jgi:hypothetical protein
MWEGCRWCLQQISILVSSYSFHGQLVLIFELRAFVTRGQLTWALFAQYVSQFSASITKHALLAEQISMLRKEVKRENTPQADTC